MNYKVIITVIRDDETEIERDFIYHKDKDYTKEVESIINALEEEPTAPEEPWQDRSEFDSNGNPNQ